MSREDAAQRIESESLTRIEGAHETRRPASPGPPWRFNWKRVLQNSSTTQATGIPNPRKMRAPRGLDASLSSTAMTFLSFPCGAFTPALLVHRDHKNSRDELPFWRQNH
ncbi:hypothetical protein EJ02DRAFT_459968, partial [Clathrospora elynae]